MKTETNNDAARDAGQKETVGRSYNTTRWGVHSRRIGGNGTWYGTNHYKSKEDALKHIRSIGKPILGGMVSFPAGKDPFEYRIVRVESVCTVEHVEEQLV